MTTTDDNDDVLPAPGRGPEQPQNEGTRDDYYRRQKARVLEARAKRLTLTATAEQLGITRQTIHRWAQDDPEFAAALETAKEQAVEVLKESVYERAFKDSILAMFVIKAHDPAYNDKVQAARAFAEASRGPALDLADVIRAEVGRLLEAGLQPRRRLDAPRATIEATARPADSSPVSADTDQASADSGQSGQA